MHQAAASVQEDYIIVTNKKTGVAKEYKNKTAFYGHHMKKDGGELSETNAFLGTEVTPDDFEIEELCRYKDDIDDHLDWAVRNFDQSVGALKRRDLAEDYRLVIGGGENFRYALAQEIPYKGKRTEKPLIFAELREVIIEKYKSKLIIADGREADDVMAQLGLKNYKQYLKTGKWGMVLSYIDKDLKMIVSPHVNPDKVSEGITHNTPEDAARCYAIQLLMGDKSVDNIPGLTNITVELREKYGVRKGKGVGKVTAEGLLKTAKTPKEMFQRVVDAYKAYHGEETTTFTNFRDEELTWGWKDYISDRANLLWMYRTKKCEYNIFTDTFDKLGVEY
jgi:hypothetical protein